MGRSFAHWNLRSRMQFAECVPDFDKLSPPATQLGRSPFVELLSVKFLEFRIFYAREAAEETWRKYKLRMQSNGKPLNEEK